MTIIDKTYQEQIQRMHAKGKFNNGAKQFGLIEPFIEQYRPTDLIDFGCGKGALIAAIKQQWPNISVSGYDPGNAEFEQLPGRPFDTVISTDAIEHIEPEHLDQTLKLIDSMMLRCGFFRIACHPAKKRLPDGRNAHLIVEQPSWWRQRILDNMNVDIVWEREVPFDRRDRNPLLFGSKYDLIMVKR
jgi:cyclopropane fatty-acyl-phospholipid synthase-like methyltransferase